MASGRVEPPQVVFGSTRRLAPVRSDGTWNASSSFTSLCLAERTCTLVATSIMVATFVGTLGAWFIHMLIWVFGRRRPSREIAWLMGPMGQRHIGDRPYEETAQAEGLTLERNAEQGGLIPSFADLASSDFDPDRVDPRIRSFYENTAGYRLDAWATTYFPARVALWLLVKTISRRVDQLNFPLEGLETARGMTSEIVLLRRGDGTIKYTGWFRKLRTTARAIYTGFYMTERIPHPDTRCVKVVFPMPNGNATVVLRPENDVAGGLRLSSNGTGYGDVGFYRMTRLDAEHVRVWTIRTLHETFRLYIDDEGVVRCDHDVRFLGFRVLSLHYRISPAATV